MSFVQRRRSGAGTILDIAELNPASGDMKVLTPAVEGSREADVAWTPDGTLLMAKGDELYAWRAGQQSWKAVASLERMGLHGVTRLAVSPTGQWIALVATAAGGR